MFDYIANTCEHLKISHIVNEKQFLSKALTFSNVDVYIFLEYP